MSFFKNIILLLLVVFLFNSCIGARIPVANHAASGVNGESRLSVTINPTKLSKPIGDFPELLSMSFWRKSDEDTSYEFYLAGVRRIENLYQNGMFYFNAFASIYLKQK